MLLYAPVVNPVLRRPATVLPHAVIWGLLLLFALPLQAQLTEDDKQQIRVEAEKTVREFRDLLQVMAKKTGDFAYRAQVRKESLNPRNPERIFWDEEARIEDDLDPRLDTLQGSPLELSSYLFRLDQSFQPKNEQDAVEFDRIQTFEVGEKVFVYAKVYFRSKLNGTYRRTQDDNYQRLKKTANIKAVRDQNGDWRAYITYVGYATKEEVALIYGGEDSYLLVTDIENAQEKLREELIEVERTIGGMLAEINALRPGGAISDEKIEQTRARALKYAIRADSLAGLAEAETEKIKQIMAVAKVRANAADSLFDAFARQVNKMQNIADAYPLQIDSVKESTQRVQANLSDAEVAFFIVDTLVTAISPKEEVDDIVSNYGNASSVARNAEKASKNAIQELEQVKAILFRMRQGKEESEKASTLAYNFQQEAREILAAARSNQRRVEDNNRRAEVYLAQAERAIVKLDSMLGPLAEDPKPLLDQILVARIEDENYRLRTKAQDASDLAKSLNEAAITANNKALIKEAAIVVDLANEIYDKVDASQPAFDEAIADVQNAGKISEGTEEILNEIIQAKNAALTDIRQARRAVNRSRYTATGTDQIIEKSKNTLARVTQEKQEAITSSQQADRYIRLAQIELNDIREAQRRTSRFSSDANLNVNQAFRKVVKRSVATRRHYTPYLGINYNAIRSSRRNFGQSPVYDGFGFDRLGFSLYYRVGVFFSGYGRYRDPIPEQAYTEDYQEKVHLELKARRESFDSAVYVAPGANLRHYNLGVYFSPIRHLYIKAGYTAVRGVTWDYYQGGLSAGKWHAARSRVRALCLQQKQHQYGQFSAGPWPTFGLMGRQKWGITTTSKMCSLTLVSIFPYEKLTP
jgi:hypothetical protein